MSRRATQPAAPPPAAAAPAPGVAGPALATLAAALRRAGRRRARRDRAHQAARFLVRGPALLLAWVLADWALGLPPGLLLPIFAGAAVWTASDAVRRLLLPACRRVRPAEVALALESEAAGGLENLLIGAWQLGHEPLPDGATPRHSASLVSVLVARAAARAAELAGCPPPRLSGWRTLRLAAAGILSVWICLTAAGRPALADRLDRLMDSWYATLELVLPVELHVTPGATAILRGQPVTLAVHAQGARRRQITLALLDDDGKPVREQILPLAGRRAAFREPAVARDFQYLFRYGRRRAGPFRVRVGERPAIQAINYELTYPAYTGQQPRTLTGRQARLQALAGTAVLISLAATTELHPELSYVVWQDGSRQPVAVNGRFGHFAFTITQADQAVLHLASRLGAGFEMEQPWSLEIAVVRDQAPQVRLSVRGERAVMMAEQAAALTVPYVAEDDFGVAEVRLDYRIEAVDELLGRAAREGTQTRGVDPAADRAVGRFAEPFKDVDPPLAPGDRLKIVAVATDNNSETGPGIARSAPFEVVVVQADLGAFAEAKLGFGETAALLGGLRRVKRNTNLLVDPSRTVRTEADHPVERKALDARQSPELWPAGAEDAIGDYFRLLSGGQ